MASQGSLGRCLLFICKLMHAFIAIASKVGSNLFLPYCCNKDDGFCGSMIDYKQWGQFSLWPETRAWAVLVLYLGLYLNWRSDQHMNHGRDPTLPLLFPWLQSPKSGPGQEHGHSSPHQSRCSRCTGPSATTYSTCLHPLSILHYQPFPSEIITKTLTDTVNHQFPILELWNIKLDKKNRSTMIGQDIS